MNQLDVLSISGLLCYGGPLLQSDRPLDPDQLLFSVYFQLNPSFAFAHLLVALSLESPFFLRQLIRYLQRTYQYRSEERRVGKERRGLVWQSDLMKITRELC